MNKNVKIGLVVLASIIIIVIIIMAFTQNKNEEIEEEKENPEEVELYTTELDDGTRLNISEEFNSEKNYNGLKISNIQFTEKDGMSLMIADVTNMTPKKHEVEIVEITIYGKDGEKITKIEPIIGEVEAGKTIKLNATILADVVNAKYFTIESKD